MPNPPASIFRLLFGVFGAVALIRKTLIDLAVSHPWPAHVGGADSVVVGEANGNPESAGFRVLFSRPKRAFPIGKRFNLLYRL